MLKYADKLRPRLPVLIASATVVAVLGIGRQICGSVFKAWRLLGVHSIWPSFADTRTITHSIDCLLAGQNPYFVRSFDPMQRVYNYPPIWLDARYFGITSRSSSLIGVLLALIMAGACLLLFRATTWTCRLIVFFAITSASVLFAAERGNTDELIFSMLVFGFFWIDRQRAEWKPLFTGLLIGLLTVLKIYPIVASAVFLRSRNGIWKTLVTGTLSATALVVTCGHALPILLANTPRDTRLSFGAFPFFLSASKHTLRAFEPLIQDYSGTAPLGALFLIALSLLAVYLWGDRIGELLPRLDFEHARGRIAVSCLAIFCFAFIAGASYDYRLLFLLGPLAWLVEDYDNGASRRSLPLAVLILFLLIDNSFSLSAFHELLDGLVFVLATLWLGTSLFYRTAGRERARILQPKAFELSRYS